ncbi:hypothetical protein COCC4DRAFT_150258 [Bipolaris maydis ATCC 48331]|uniref:Uncharacterized protein n=2 Tax=Cochliobolus heterostrophus TaxID=5016 RepID=M2V949_COCH5|nr:uncharacterized protein COCC4DRAFT_150258 [Bipolaris maydis ATCC 48331]EMD96497.1 hypothetical protein COCHEDRAFT_1025034 [Bipolaris maydis C5]KAH7548913.1 hypothetical protein BM1_10686 [Bipolaris maydis]ENI00675.1 hypothetical protein COCC4DRAFT_150258 [Bipolaris maydis ATCC 48331]KAJ5031608.1 hypothetical protein J3E73DRAFT_252586 [Bipolaris maydis]KAJ5035276.1 hypothetical protein J3E74DRAFT_296840 [Bipolaris maydis]
MQSRHLPINSILFHDYHEPASNPATSSNRPQSAALVNVQDASDLSITALPRPPTVTITTTRDGTSRESLWKRLRAAISGWLCFGKKSEKRRKREPEEGAEVKYQ